MCDLVAKLVDDTGLCGDCLAMKKAYAMERSDAFWNVTGFRAPEVINAVLEAA